MGYRIYGEANLISGDDGIGSKYEQQVNCFSSNGDSNGYIINYYGKYEMKDNKDMLPTESWGVDELLQLWGKE